MGTSGPLLDIAVGRKLVEIAAEGASDEEVLGAVSNCGGHVEIRLGICKFIYCTVI